MDPNIMKFLEEDEDETMHSGADVEAFTAELNRDIEGNSSVSQQQPSDSESAALSHGSSQTTSQFLQQWQSSGHVGIVNFQSGEDHIVMEQHGPDPLNRKDDDGSAHAPNGLPFTQNQSLDSCPDPQDNQSAFSVSQNDTSMSCKQPALNQKPDPNSERDPQMHKLQTLSNQQSMTMGLSSEEAMTSGSTESTNQQPGASMKLNKQVPFGMLLPIIQPQLDKDRAMQLQILYTKLKKNELSKDGFMRHMRSIVGDQMLKMAAYKLQTRLLSQHQASLRQMQVSSDLTNTTSNSSIVTPHQVENQVDQHNTQASFPAHGGAASSYSPFPTNNVASLTSFRPQFQDSQMRQAPAHQNINTSHLGSTVRPRSITNMNMQAGLGTLTHVNSNSTLQQNQVQWPSAASKEQTFGVSSSMNYVKQEQVDQSNEMHPSRTGFTPPTSMANAQMRSITPPGNFKAPLKKPVVGQKKPMEAPGSSPASSKKQKVSGAFLDQSIEQLNDVTAVSGVNLREEEEQLFSGSKEDSRVTEASRKVVQEEEERLILHKLPLQKKVVEIMAKSGLKSMSNDVERCLSLCVEERMRGLITNLIRLSKQRVDIEKPRHRTVITSDIRQQIMTINRKAREECEKNQAETAKSQNPVENEDSAGVDGEKDEARAKATKVNKEEDDKMRTTAANVAVRAATGVGDMLSRWQLMIANQNKGGTDTSSSSQPGKDVARKPLPTSTRKTKDSREAGKRNSSAGSVRKVGRNQVMPRVARSITVKDVIAILEREPQMSKSILIYRLYDKVRAYAAPE